MFKKVIFKKTLKLYLFMRKLAILLICTITTYTFAIAQCGFNEQRSKQRQNPEFVKMEKNFENKIQHHIKNGLVSAKSGTVYTIPTVVHVLHKGEAVGTGTNISVAQIQSAIDRLNEVYRGSDPNSPIDFEVEFQLAQRDPSCNATTGINRVDATVISGYDANGVFFESAGADEDDLKDLSRWPETDYFNIWVVSEIDGNNGGAGIQGYANFFNGNLREGSVMMYTVFGYDPGNTNGWGLNSNGDGGTVVHECGHYLHLYHTFQGDGTGSTCPDDVGVGVGSDGCADTETHKRHTSTCPANNDCNSNNPYGINTLQNYMSYFSCADRLTSDQKTRVRAALLGTSIVSSKGATAPDPGYAAPVAVCNTNTVTTNNAGIISVELNGVTFSSFSSLSDGGNIDNSANCSNYFEIDASVANTINVGMFTVNFQQLGVWIDWNDDGDFDDDAEQQHLSEDISASSTVPVNLTYPASIPYDDYVRVRLITDLDDRHGAGTINSPCYGSLTYGQSEDYTIYVKPNASAPPVAAFSAASTTLCDGGSTVFTDASTNTPTSWAWTFTPSTVTYINSTSSTSQNPEVQFDAAGTYQVQLTATNASGSDDEIKVGYITVNGVPSDAGAITGSVSECENVSGVIYSIAAVNGATNYTWEVPSGGTITSGQNTTSITVDFGVTSGNVSVTPSNSCGDGSGSSKFVTLNTCETPNLRVGHCGYVMSNIHTQVYSTLISGATKYEFELTPKSGGDPIYYLNNHNFRLKFAWFSGWSYNTVYNVRVRAYVSGSWTGYGSICELTSPNIPSPPTLRPAHCGYTVSTIGEQVYATEIKGATEYEFELTPQGGGGVINYLSCCNFRLNFAWFSGWSYNTTYDVRVRAKVDGSFTSYGASCELTTPAAPVSIVRYTNNDYTPEYSGEFANESVLLMNIYPNPNEGESFGVEIQGAVPNTIVYVTDISGKTILYKDLNNENENMRTSLAFDSKLSRGFYMVTLISGDQKVTEKLIVR